MKEPSPVNPPDDLAKDTHDKVQVQSQTFN